MCFHIGRDMQEPHWYLPSPRTIPASANITAAVRDVIMAGNIVISFAMAEAEAGDDETSKHRRSDVYSPRSGRRIYYIQKLHKIRTTAYLPCMHRHFCQGHPVPLNAQCSLMVLYYPIESFAGSGKVETLRICPPQSFKRRLLPWMPLGF